MTEPESPPRHLSALSKRVWREVLETWELDPTGVLLLRAGLERYDLYDRARKELAKEKSVAVTGGSGVTRAHPASKIATDALSEARQCFRQLGLEMPDPGEGWRGVAMGRRGAQRPET